MNIKLNGKLEDISAMLLSAERYALGRMTYIVEWTCLFIISNMHLVTEHDRKIMIRDIKNCENYGWDCDREQWEKLLKILESEENKNEK